MMTFDVIEELKECGIEPVVSDDVADKTGAEKLHKIFLISLNEVRNAEVVAVCVGHDIYRKLKKEEGDRM